MDLKDLTGKKIEAAFFHGGNLYLRTPGGDAYKLEPSGDCCSHCYIQHISGADALREAEVTAVESIESEPTEEEKKDADVLDGWGHKLITTRGHVSIEMRLDHNGYYGGNLKVLPGWGVPVDAKLLEDF